ncbi:MULTISPECIES: copper homeostasis protein CutC [Oceanobacillus]|uniref:PF03932 family protein CutC n=1 Tax=Oceanobacillus kimchii TaxID=746691 RepID=A0ABQ5TMY1_9BACI|nr:MULTISPECIES: copper homeostasis protein CutC [Oceanobacillus]MBT2600390.1 copper homeostasis protein CutC [Oceanobacillus sp. ISL-74]MBT2650548.1 copper homeostasis protein CutC [Oceanobacillus sp. ISL-73]MCT1578289.1 copper homeostasis protein CutC [Oceanobacillus kimchii]MCT2134467.1 copper homeostasis protein CutC [Oceanobacillus kimchii]OEH54909.1 copper homeostasis protein CutC [Oceanobacillus sp. E9]
MYIEAIVQTVEEAIQAEKFGVDRLELVSGMKEGGLTPSYGTIKKVLEHVNIPVQIMVRPHSYHFIYTACELDTIYEDIRNIVELGGRGIVFGALHRDSTINMDALETAASISDELDITVHRAFDEVPSLEEAYLSIAECSNVQRILTSGGSSNCLEGKQSLKSLVELANSSRGPSILPGGGLNMDNFNEIHYFVQADQYHFGTGIQTDGDFSKGLDAEKLQVVKRIS